MSRQTWRVAFLFGVYYRLISKLKFDIKWSGLIHLKLEKKSLVMGSSLHFEVIQQDTVSWKICVRNTIRYPKNIWLGGGTWYSTSVEAMIGFFPHRSLQGPDGGSHSGSDSCQKVRRGQGLFVPGLGIRWQHLLQPPSSLNLVIGVHVVDCYWWHSFLISGQDGSNER